MLFFTLKMNPPTTLCAELSRQSRLWQSITFLKNKGKQRVCCAFLLCAHLFIKNRCAVLCSRQLMNAWIIAVNSGSLRQRNWQISSDGNNVHWKFSYLIANSVPFPQYMEFAKWQTTLPLFSLSATTYCFKDAQVCKSTQWGVLYLSIPNALLLLLLFTLFT